jgi:hypothetical protein
VMALSVAVPAMAGNGRIKPPKPDKPGPELEVTLVDFAGNDMWSILEAPGDTVVFQVTTDGKAPAAGILCVTTEPSSFCEESADGTSSPYAVQAGDIVVGKSPKFAGTVTYKTYSPESGDSLSGSFDLNKKEYLTCSEAGLTTTLSGTYEGSFPEFTTCRWQPDESGVWNVTLSAAGECKKATPVWLTLRDHVPGNWCAASDTGPAGWSGRLRGDETVPLVLETPENGICRRGGASGDKMGVGNPTTFVLDVKGDVTLEWLRSTP